ncbi:glycine cleavage system protein GcvH [Saccharospirillum sp.]|uniref:glycine cleavage system protein GcvH n=1 Tax=Saccharospirillum sp. TaxID=2033801 RepID=UPI0034A046B1
MTAIPTELRYAKSHEWVRDNGDGTVTVGITDHAQTQLGDVVFVELPEVGQELSAGGECAVIESVKAASDIYSPISGTVTSVNDNLEDAPETINEACYTDGWIFTLTPAADTELDALLTADQYQANITSTDA